MYTLWNTSPFNLIAFHDAGREVAEGHVMPTAHGQALAELAKRELQPAVMTG